MAEFFFVLMVWGESMVSAGKWCPPSMKEGDHDSGGGFY
jgi:hypothetical protein